MADRTVKITITGDDQSGEVINSAGQRVEKLANTHTEAANRVAMQWVQAAVQITGAFMAIEKAMSFAEFGAKAQQARASFEALARSANLNANEVIDAMNRAAAGTIDDSDLMLKATKALNQGAAQSKDDLIRLTEMSRVAARFAGEDVSHAYEAITDAIANNLPRALVRYGLVTKEQVSVINQAMASGATDINLFAIASANAGQATANLGGVALDNAERIQQFKAQIAEAREEMGIRLFQAGVGIVVVFEAIGVASLLTSAGLYKLIAAEHEVRAMLSWGDMKTRHLELAEALRSSATADIAAADNYFKTMSNNIDLILAKSDDLKKAMGGYQYSGKSAQQILAEQKAKTDAETAAREALKLKKELDQLWIESEGNRVMEGDKINKEYFANQQSEEKAQEAERLRIWADNYQLEVKAAYQAEEAITAKKEMEEAKRLQISQQVADNELKMKLSVANGVISIMTMLGTKNKALAIAGIALQTAVNEITTFQAGVAAAALASKDQFLIGDPYTAPARAAAAAAAVMAWTYGEMALIAASGIIQGVQSFVGSGGGNSDTISGTVGGYPSDNSSTSTWQQTAPAPAQISPVINIHIYGNVVDQDKFARELIPSITKAIEDGVH